MRESASVRGVGLFRVEADGGGSGGIAAGEVLAQAEAASEEAGVERAVRRALRGHATLVSAPRQPDPGLYIYTVVPLTSHSTQGSRPLGRHRPETEVGGCLNAL